MAHEIVYKKKFQVEGKVVDADAGKRYQNVYNCDITGVRSAKMNPSCSTVSPIVNSTGRLYVGPSRAKL
jgi:hypothetical protein